jgi:hypothetical protein
MTSYDDSDSENEAPLNPAQKRLRRKLVRLLLVSGGIMVLGLIAVFASIVYKLGERGEGSAARLSASAPVGARISLPAGHRIEATALDGDRALLTLVGPDGATSLLLVDLSDGSTLGRYAVAPE